MMRKSFSESDWAKGLDLEALRAAKQGLLPVFSSKKLQVTPFRASKRACWAPAEAAHAALGPHPGHGRSADRLDAAIHT